MMKKKLFLAMMAVVAVFATLSFSACSSSDDDNNNTPSGGNGKAQVNAYVAIDPNQLNLFDITVKVNNGDAVQLTTSNTTVKELVVDTDPQTKKEITKSFRVYDLGTTTITSFPASYTLVAETKIKEGVDLASQPKSDYSLSPVITGVDAIGRSIIVGELSYSKGVDWSKVTSSSILLRTKTKICSFDANGKYVSE